MNSNDSFGLEPGNYLKSSYNFLANLRICNLELSFPDSTYSDVFYFLDPRTSSASFWTIRQLELTDKGYFKYLDTFVVRSVIKEVEKAHIKQLNAKHDLILSMNFRNRMLYAVEKNRRKLVYSTNVFDLLFR